MIENIIYFQVIDLVNKDFGRKGGLKRDIMLHYQSCKYQPENVTLRPSDMITFHPCKGKKPLSWQGTLRWDGRHLRDSSLPPVKSWWQKTKEYMRK